MSNPPQKSIFLVSACLVGLCTRYDGTIKENTECRKFLKDHLYIPVCPEQLGGMPTPRPAADILNGDGQDVLRAKARVCTKKGEDVSDFFIKGAEQVLQIAESQEIAGVCLKSRSPSCAISGIIGVTAALLKINGFKLYEF